MLQDIKTLNEIVTEAESMMTHTVNQNWLRAYRDVASGCVRLIALIDNSTIVSGLPPEEPK